MADATGAGADSTSSVPASLVRRVGRAIRRVLQWGGRVLGRLYRHPMSGFGTSVVGLFVIMALFAPWIAPFTATEQNFGAALQPPSAEHPFGTDRFGRDVFSRVMIGSQSILASAGIGTLVAVMLGTGLGLLSGYWGGWFDEIVMRIFDSILAIPALLLALLLVGTLGPSQASVLLVIAVVYVPIVARVVRSDVLAIKTRDYVETARLQGESTAFILRREILPSVLPALSVEAALRFSYAIFLVASLGFLGVGVQPPTPNWGLMVQAARDFTGTAPWWLIAPAGAISVVVVGTNLFADGLKRILQSPEAIIAAPDAGTASSEGSDVEESHGASGHAPNASEDDHAASPASSTSSDSAPEDAYSTVSSRDSEERPLLELREVTVSYRSQGADVDAVREASLAIRPGETLGLVGESGSGKTTLALAALRYLPSNGSIREGAIRFDDRDIRALGMAELRELWGAAIGFVPQNPAASLNPSQRVGAQIAELLERHTDWDDDAIAERIRTLLRDVRIGDPDRVAQSYPHQLSGGMKQRAMVAMALSTSPRLLIMDEPTTGLDVTTEAAVLDLIEELIAERGTAMLYISHDLGVVARVADRVAVLYAGELVEEAPTEALYARPRHPYTQGLIDSVPRLGERKRDVRLSSMRGRIPAPSERPSGCVFAPRCPVAIEACWAAPPPLARIDGRDPDAGAGADRRVRCIRWRAIARAEISARSRAPAPSDTDDTSDSPDSPDEAPRSAEKPVLDIQSLSTHFPVRRSLGQFLQRAPRQLVRAVDGIDLRLQPGETLGLVGESGSGKTTLARTILGLVQRTGGDTALRGEALPAELDERGLDMLRHLQLVAQSPDEALNPYQTVGEILRRPISRLQGLARQEADRRVGELLSWVRLGPEYAPRLPVQLSGGEKQRVAIARAFAARPELVVCDEPTSALDVSVQSRILNLLADLQRDYGGSYLFISHDLAIVGYLADEIAVIYLGQLMDLGRRETFFDPPYHPYTEALLSSVPQLASHAPPSQRVRLEGEVPSATDVPSGCPFHTRCPRYIGSICENKTPPVRETADGRRIACHIPLEELEREQPSFVADDSESPPDSTTSEGEA